MKEKYFTIKGGATEITFFMLVEVVLGIIFGVILADNPHPLLVTFLLALTVINTYFFYLNAKTALKLQYSQGECAMIKRLKKEIEEQRDGFKQA